MSPSVGSCLVCHQPQAFPTTGGKPKKLSILALVYLTNSISFSTISLVSYHKEETVLQEKRDHKRECKGLSLQICKLRVQRGIHEKIHSKSAALWWQFIKLEVRQPKNLLLRTAWLKFEFHTIHIAHSFVFCLLSCTNKEKNNNSCVSKQWGVW